MANFPRRQFLLFLLVSGITPGVFSAPAAAQTSVIATVAGNGNYGYSGDGGLARLATIGNPGGIAVDASGNIYFADTSNSRIRKISPGGVITTVAGNGVYGYSGDGGQAATAELSSANGIVIDKSGNLLFADSGNSRIRKVAANGIITTLAGNGKSGFSGDGAAATSAQLNQPAGIAIDASGNLFIADSGNQRVREVAVSGTITTVAGNGKPGFSGDSGPATSAQLNQPQGVAIDPSGNLLIADSGNLRIRKVNGGTITTFAGDGKFGFTGNGVAAASSEFSYIEGIGADASGNLFVADSINGVVRKVSAAGIVTVVAGGGNPPQGVGDGGPPTSAYLYPLDVATNAAGNLFISDSGGRIRAVLTQSSVPIVAAAVNAADYSPTVAQGSLVAIFGSSMGPSSLVKNEVFPIPTLLSGTSVTVTSGSTTLDCPLLYTLAGQVGAILPSGTPPGTALITVSYNNQTGPYGLSVTQATVVPTSPGIFTQNESGSGAGDFNEAASGSPKGFTSSAKPGELLTLWLTGLGPISTPDNQLPTSFPNFPNVQLWVGGQQVTPAYAGRSGCCSADDQINFTVPQITNGCNVPVVVVSGGVVSNSVTLSINGTGGQCANSGPTVPTSILTKANAAQPVKVAILALGPRGTGIGNGSLPFPNVEQAAAKSISAALHTPVSQADAARLIRAYASGKPRAVRTAMAKYARQWKALDAPTKARLAAQLGQTSEGAVAAFSTYSNEGGASAFISAQFPVAGSCVLLPDSVTAGQGTRGSSLDAGRTLSLSGAAGSLTLTSSGISLGEYHGAFPASITGPNVPPGSYTISGTGGPDVGAFSAALTIKGNLAISNKSALATIDRTQPLTVTWTGGLAGNYVLIGGYTPHVISSGTPLAYFACAQDAGAGTLTIPPYILSAMNATATGKGVIAISPHPLTNQVSIPGIDLAYFIDGSSDTASVTFK